MELLYLTLLAQTYSCDAYGAGAYGECLEETTDTAPTPGGNTGGGLADTGYDIILPLALGASILIASIILLVKKLRQKKSV